MKYNGFDIPDEIIDSYVDKLDCSIVDAMQAYLFDTGKADSAEEAQLTKKAAAAGIGKIVDAEYKKTERKPREKKVNQDKRDIIDLLFYTLLGEMNDNKDIDFVEIRNLEKYIDLGYNGKSYTINLVEHRKEKK